MSTTTILVTAEELFAKGDVSRRELVNGEIVYKPLGGFQHGRITAHLSRLIGEYVDRHQLGEVTAAETGFTISRNPDTVRAPDVGFISVRRIPTTVVQGYFPGAPDLAVEVISPTDMAGEIQTKIGEWLDAGTTSVWVIYPVTRSIEVHWSDRRGRGYGRSDVVADEPTLPGFRLEVASLFRSR